MPERAQLPPYTQCVVEMCLSVGFICPALARVSAESPSPGWLTTLNCCFSYRFFYINRKNLFLSCVRGEGCVLCWSKRTWFEAAGPPLPGGSAVTCSLWPVLALFHICSVESVQRERLSGVLLRFGSVPFVSLEFQCHSVFEKCKDATQNISTIFLSCLLAWRRECSADLELVSSAGRVVSLNPQLCGPWERNVWAGFSAFPLQRWAVGPTAGVHGRRNLGPIKSSGSPPREKAHVKQEQGLS